MKEMKRQMMMLCLTKLQKMAMMMAVLVVTVIMGSASAQTKDAHKAGWVGDLPVPAEALIDTSTAVNFDSPSGRVVMFRFESALDQSEVTGFFDDALVGLGWDGGIWQGKGGTYQRGREELMILFDGTGGAGRYSYRMSVKPAS